MQENNKFFNIGEKIQLMLLNDYDNNQYVSRIEELNEDSSIDVLIPIARNKMLYIKNDTLIKVIVAREGAIYEFKAKIINKLFGVVPLLRLMRVSDIIKIQRRNYYRLKVLKTIKLRKVINLKEMQFDEHFNGYLIDISGGGLGFTSNKDLEDNDIIEINMELNSSFVTVFGRVIRKDYLEDSKRGSYAYGIQYEKITELERNSIMRYIFEEQRKLAKKGLI